MKYLINLMYDGSKFYGYQIQDDLITVEGELERVLSKIFNTNINTIASSRTDKGVHALNQYAMFSIDRDINTKDLKRSVNSLINESIYVKNINKVNESFNTRSNVINKEYVYKINMGSYNPLEKDYVYQYNKKIDRILINDFIYKVSGKHNFRSFTSDKDNINYIRDIKLTYKITNNILYLTFSSKGFLRYMIRNIVGLLLDINDGKKSIEDIDNIFKNEDRTSLGVCASGCGLYLNKIDFKK